MGELSGVSGIGGREFDLSGSEAERWLRGIMHLATDGAYILFYAIYNPVLLTSPAYIPLTYIAQCMFICVYNVYVFFLTSPC